MGGSTLAVPDLLQTVPVDGVAAVERWAALCRAELARLALELSAANRSIEEVGTGVDHSGRVQEVLAQIDAELGGAWKSAERAIEAACGEADRRVAMAVSFAVNTVTIAGVDAAGIEALDPRPRTAPALTAPRSAGELWCDAVGAAQGDDRDLPAPPAEVFDPIGHDPDREFWSDVAEDRPAFSWFRRRGAEA